MSCSAERTPPPAYTRARAPTKRSKQAEAKGKRATKRRRFKPQSKTLFCCLTKKKRVTKNVCAHPRTLKIKTQITIGANRAPRFATMLATLSDEKRDVFMRVGAKNTGDGGGGGGVATAAAIAVASARSGKQTFFFSRLVSFVHDDKKPSKHQKTKRKNKQIFCVK